jgi:hypothetical protein
MSTQSAPWDPGTRYATFGTPMGIIFIEFGFSCFLTEVVDASALTDLGMGATTLLLRDTNEGAVQLELELESG